VIGWGTSGLRRDRARQAEHWLSIVYFFGYAREIWRTRERPRLAASPGVLKAQNPGR
jgi:hypothetical protein